MKVWKKREKNERSMCTFQLKSIFRDYFVLRRFVKCLMKSNLLISFFYFLFNRDVEMVLCEKIVYSMKSKRWWLFYELKRNICVRICILYSRWNTRNISWFTYILFHFASLAFSLALLNKKESGYKKQKLNDKKQKKNKKYFKYRVHCRMYCLSCYVSY